jgi:hypothetical protein
MIGGPMLACSFASSGKLHTDPDIMRILEIELKHALDVI